MFAKLISWLARTQIREARYEAINEHTNARIAEIRDRLNAFGYKVT